MPVKQRPNLVYVFADQLRYQSCGYAGRHPRPDTSYRPTCNGEHELLQRRLWESDVVPRIAPRFSPENTPVAPVWRLMNSE